MKPTRWDKRAEEWLRTGRPIVSEPFVDHLEKTPRRKRRRTHAKQKAAPTSFAASSLPPSDRE